MMISEAIDTAVSEHTVHFLVTAYLESLHHFHQSLGIPESVVRFPLGDKEDMARRLAALYSEITVPLEAIVCIVEARMVLRCALERLTILERDERLEYSTSEPQRFRERVPYAFNEKR